MTDRAKKVTELPTANAAAANDVLILVTGVGTAAANTKKITVGNFLGNVVTSVTANSIAAGTNNQVIMTVNNMAVWADLPTDNDVIAVSSLNPDVLIPGTNNQVLTIVNNVPVFANTQNVVSANSSVDGILKVVDVIGNTDPLVAGSANLVNWVYTQTHITPGSNNQVLTTVNNALAWANTANTFDPTAALSISNTITATQTITSNAAFIATSGTLNAQTGTSYLITSADNGKTIVFSNTANVTVSVPAMSVGFSAMFIQTGNGFVVFAANATNQHAWANSSRTSGQFAVATLLFYSSNNYILGGNII